MEVSNYRLTLRAFECHLDNGVVFKGFFLRGGGAALKSKADEDPERHHQHDLVLMTIQNLTKGEMFSVLNLA